MERLFGFMGESNRLQSDEKTSRNADDHRIGFMPAPNSTRIRAFLFTVNMNVTFNSYAVQHEYYESLQSYFEERLEQLRLSEGVNPYIYPQVKHG